MESCSINQNDNLNLIHEKNIISNKHSYILLNENPDCSVDILNDIQNLYKHFELGQMVHTEDFKLEDTMSAVELNHLKMDPHNHNE